MVAIHPRSDGKGYLLVRADPEDVEDVGPRYVAVHRLVAYAHGDIDSLSDPREIHHRDTVPSHNAPSNLEALEASEHGQITRRVAQRRRATDD